jgi:hypothetical protein
MVRGGLIFSRKENVRLMFMSPIKTTLRVATFACEAEGKALTRVVLGLVCRVNMKSGLRFCDARQSLVFLSFFGHALNRVIRTHHFLSR